MKKSLLTLLLGVAVCPLMTGCGSKVMTPLAPKFDKTTPKAYYESLMTHSKTLPGLYIETESTIGSMKNNMKQWIDGEKIKFEKADRSGDYSITKDDKIINYVAKENVAYVMKDYDDSSDTEENDDTEDSDTSVVKLLEETSYNGFNCQMFEISYTDSSDIEKMCLSTKYGIPVYTEARIDNTTAKSEVKVLKVGKLPAGTFEIPVGVKVVDSPY